MPWVAHTTTIHRIWAGESPLWQNLANWPNVSHYSQIFQRHTITHRPLISYDMKTRWFHDTKWRLLYVNVYITIHSAFPCRQFPALFPLVIFFPPIRRLPRRVVCSLLRCAVRSSPFHWSLQAYTSVRVPSAVTKRKTFERHMLYQNMNIRKGDGGLIGETSIGAARLL